MKKKKRDWSKVPWTPFEEVPVPESDLYGGDGPKAMLVNSRYQVGVWFGSLPEPWGDFVHLSFKTHDRSAHHDWRDMQRIKNEIVGPEFEAVELFPAERRLVDSANQYHLFVFRTLRLPFGFQDRLVAEGSYRDSKQRPFDPDVRPTDLVSDDQFQKLIDDRLRKLKEATTTT